MLLTLKPKCSSKLVFTLHSYPLSYDCAGIQILNDNKVRQGHLVIVQKAEVSQDRAPVASSWDIQGRRIPWKLGSWSEQDLEETEGRQPLSQIGQRRPRVKVTI